MGCHVLAIGLLASPAVPAVAQRWEVGAKTGVSHVETSSDEFSWGPSSSSALSVRYALDETFAIQPEFAHIRRNGLSVVGASELRMVADYLEIPVLLHARMRERSGFAPFLNVGPNVALRLRCRLRFTGGGLTTDDPCEGSQSIRSTAFDVGVSAGAGIGWTFDGATVTVESRLITGLRHFVLPTDVADARSVGWAFFGGVSFPLGPRSRRPRGPVWSPQSVAVSTSPALTPEPLPPLPATSIASPDAIAARVATSAGPRIRLSADNVDVRDVLYGIARISGVNVAVSPDVNVRVSAVLHDVTAEEAIQAIVDVTGLAILKPSRRDGTTVVFFQKPVNINTASARQITERFGVSRDIAGLIVETQPSAPRP